MKWKPCVCALRNCAAAWSKRWSHTVCVNAFAHIGVQRGMFSYTGLSPEQVKQLREHHSVYMVSSGRANVAGIDATRLALLAEAIACVCK
jgi:aspartate/tyrosine/aromatic aminotransferase